MLKIKSVKNKSVLKMKGYDMNGLSFYAEKLFDEKAIYFTEEFFDIKNDITLISHLRTNKSTQQKYTCIHYKYTYLDINRQQKQNTCVVFGYFGSFL